MKWLTVFALIPLVTLTARATTAETTIRNILIEQAEAWNKGDLSRFVFFYSDPCTLIGTTISKPSRAQVLKHYRQKYPSPGAMGKLLFSGIEIRAMHDQMAVVTGQWHLDRGRESGGPVGGVFSLVFERRNGSWQIILDHTS